MRTSKFTILGCAALMLGAASCSNELPTDGNGTYNGPVETNYLSINIVSGGGQSTRAGESSTASEGTYVDGEGVENAISMVRFYFFGSDGQSVDVLKNTEDDTWTNYMDWVPTGDPATPDNDNVEKVLDAQLVINTAKGDIATLSQIVAVINPPSNLPVITSIYDVTNSLNSITANYKVELTGNPNETPFVMSNSVYANAGTVVEGAPVANHLYASPESALADPVSIYVERVNAKATVDVLTDQNVDNPLTEEQLMINDVMTTVYKTGVNTDKANSPDEELEDTPIYVLFLGWNVTCTPNKSNLMKEINPEWTNQELFGSTTAIDWNSPTRFRSFWAVNPSLTYAPGDESSNYVYGNFNTYSQAIKSFGSAKGNNFTYMQENAGQGSEIDEASCAYPTQLIVAARLYDQDGNPLTLAEFGFNQYTLEGLQKKYASMCNIYYQTSADGEDLTTEKIPWTAITFMTAYEAGKASLPTSEGDEGGRYYVYAMLDADNETIADKKLYIGNTSDTPATEDQVKASLIGLGHAKIWNGGNTYYYVPIRHLGLTGSPAEYGVVRNHIYAMNINSLVGLGTPVWDPEEVIYPEKPKEEDTYIGAQINVLNWRLVSQDVGFVW